MRTPPLPSPAEAPSPVAASQSHPHPHEPRGPSASVSTPSFLPKDNDDDGSVMLDDSLRIANTHAASLQHQQTPDVSCISSNNIPSEYKSSDSGKGSQEDHGRSLQTLRELRRQMEELLAYQQMQQQSQDQDVTAAAAAPPSREAFASPVPPLSLPSAPRDDPPPCSSSPHESSKKRRISNDESPQLPASSSGAMPSAAAYSDSTSSAGTIRPPDSSNNPMLAGQTPSYPFPKMYPSPSPAAARSAQESSPMLNQSHFKLTLPAEKLKIGKGPSSQPSDERPPPVMKTSTPHSVFLPPQHKPVMEDPIYPSPNLYDITLQLSADPGLDAWWSNVVNILQTYYGAERASLAVPGDATDLENVPWGQKAVFDQNLSEDPDSIHQLYGETTRAGPSEADSHNTGTVANNSIINVNTTNNTTDSHSRLGSVSAAKRPSLLSRHSFAGFGKDRKHAADQDPSQLLHKIKIENAQSAATTNAMDVDSELSQSTPTGNRDKENVMTPQTHSLDDALITTTQHSYRQAVFPIPRPLEVESDPLIKRTGVVKLFGRTKPVVLTREYSKGSANVCSENHGGTMARSPADDKVQVTPTAEPIRPGVPQTPSRPAGSTLQAPALVPGLPPSMEVSDEYEQVPPSPWSQSPAPSPAPRAQAEQNPFFVSYSVDESAFAKNPPPHDYSNLQPLQAIGVDLAKSVVHIPLLHAGSSKQPSSSTLRFPVAVISILSPIIPYPSNLRQSLAYLMPHLTTSFCLAQQYSQLERQFVSRLETPRYGHLLGLGGTFSDESSELELVAGLSGHVNYRMAEDGTISAHASLSSPDEKSNSTKLSPPIPGGPGGTPGFELGTLGAATANNTDQNDVSGPSIKLSREAADSYFNVPQQQHKSFREAIMHQQRRRLSKAKEQVTMPDPALPGKSLAKASTDDDSALQDPNAVAPSPMQEPRSQAAASPTQPSTSRHPSANSLYAQLQREIPRPFSDTVAQLMLNSVPLHLFLAKPQSGEVIWTNSKFDAYRRSQPQEQKMRDPWQNIHNSEREHVSQEWANALRTGSQFTERVRVKRFNDESAYRWFIFRANPLLSSTGEVLYWIGSFLDIHEQHIAELKAAQEREKFATDAKYRAFSNSIPQVVFEAAEYRGLIFANEQWHLYTGQKLEEALNFGFAKHIHSDDLEKCGLLSHHLIGKTDSKDPSSSELPKGKNAPPERHFGHGFTPALDELVKRGVASVQQDENGRVFYSTEIRLRSKGGDFRWHLVRLVRVETSSFGNGEASWYGTCTDINDRKNLERELNKAMQQLNNQMESKTKFFSNMSHEIRTPLNGILGTIPFILDTQLDTDQRRMLDTIQNSSTNLRELVDNILDVSRVEAGKMSLVNSWFHVRSVIEDVIDTVASRAIDKSLEINYLMDVDVPPTVIGDRFRIRQVLINLVGNAVKFTSQGEIHICCSIHHDPSALAKNTELLLNFDVVDTGKGFSARDAERLMQRFSQLGQNGSQQHAGSGLGLFLSKQLVEMHGGKLTPSSKEGQGAKFSFYVKVDAPPPVTPEEQSKGARQQKASDAKTKPNQEAVGAKSPKSPAPETPASQPPTSTDSSAQPALPIPAENSSVATPDTSGAKMDVPKPDESASAPAVEPKSSPQQASPCSILILCPLENTRKAIQQHIQQVVPHEVPFTIKAYPDIDDWRDMVNEGTGSSMTHLVLNLPNVDDVMDVIQYVSECEPTAAPTLVLISDLYQKRQVNPKIKELSASGRKVYTVPKPVKPSAFSAIFDPDNRRDLSKDRNQDMAREINNNFKTMSKMVKEVIGNKGYRVLLVEDDETNRMVMLKYLDKIKVMAETASNGQECTEMVFSKEPGYYSLIICDIQMPVKNGYDTCREVRGWELKNHYPQIPIMALSANAMTDQIEDAARAGFNDYVTKPIKHNELGKMMMGLLDPNRPLLLLRDRLREDNENDDSHREE
ncbi:putative sensor histidine kinase/response regulator [Aspergillus ruber CBS 135680]|uniref:histidine kinase n=1 Tax=Aspergillus ruber (strain CBS 135680) TaxID=1388766 RepID=A0A017SBR4_ASPRC|nr:uncharacterized protein EURHEDRAFT_516173 [Aspergillus ruber CBS 135680]EYE94256.1 hypothetical protein EURHEDRAFT_516173 [Aspergillus ruber CBS 135680]